MKTKIAIAAVLVLAGTASAGEFAQDVTPPSQQYQNMINDLKSIERSRQQESARSVAEKKAAELYRQMLQNQADTNRAQIEANGRVEASKQRQPDQCVGYCPQWGQR